MNDYDVASASASRLALPVSLLKQIEGETSMGWTGWVFEMKNGKLFAYGSPYSWDFFDLPKDYTFNDVIKVHNHSYLTKDGALASLHEEGSLDQEIAAPS